MHHVAGIGHDLLSSPRGILLGLHVEESPDAVEHVADGHRLHLTLELCQHQHVVALLILRLLRLPQTEQGVALAVQIHESHLLETLTTGLRPLAVAKLLILKVLQLYF